MYVSNIILWIHLNRLSSFLGPAQHTPALKEVKNEQERPPLNIVTAIDEVDAVEDVAEIIPSIEEKDAIAPMPLKEEIAHKVIIELQNSYFTLENGDVVSMADWVISGLSKNRAGSDASGFKKIQSLEEIIRTIAASKSTENINPLLGNGAFPDNPTVSADLKVNSVKDKSAQSLISKRHMRRKEGAYTGGIYGSVSPGDDNSIGAGVISYEANISNCAHEEARTGVNRCREFERWVSQKVYEVVKAQEKKK